MHGTEVFTNRYASVHATERGDFEAVSFVRISFHDSNNHHASERWTA